MREIEVKTYYKKHLTDGYLLIHQYSNLLSNETVILRGKDLSVAVSHKEDTGLQCAEIDTKNLNKLLKKGKLKMSLMLAGLSTNYIILRAKKDFENIFVTEESNKALKLTLTEDEEGVYWEDVFCTLTKSPNQEILL